MAKPEKTLEKIVKQGRPPGRPAFFRVQQARERLQQASTLAVKELKTAMKVAAKKGNHAPAAWILEHSAAIDDQGKEVRPIAPSIDRQQIERGNGVSVNIGFITAPTAPKLSTQAPSPHLPAVEVLPLPEHEE